MDMERIKEKFFSVLGSTEIVSGGEVGFRECIFFGYDIWVWFWGYFYFIYINYMFRCFLIVESLSFFFLFLVVF